MVLKKKEKRQDPQRGVISMKAENMILKETWYGKKGRASLLTNTEI